MNRRPTGLNVTKAITGFLQYKSAEGLSPVTVTGYDHDLKLWIEYQGDMDVAQVQTTHILAYLSKSMSVLSRSSSADLGMATLTSHLCAHRAPMSALPFCRSSVNPGWSA